MLITSKTTNRFIVPKGWPMKGISGRKTAVAEAREEAGVVGEALKEPLDVYAYWKRLSGHFVRVTVKVYLLSVVDVQPDWNERSQRQRAWHSPADAAALIDEPQLVSLVRSMAQAPVPRTSGQLHLSAKSSEYRIWPTLPRFTLTSEDGAEHGPIFRQSWRRLAGAEYLRGGRGPQLLLMPSLSRRRCLARDLTGNGRPMGRIWLSPMISELASRNDEARILGVFDTVNKKEAAIDHCQFGQQFRLSRTRRCWTFAPP